MLRLAPARHKPTAALTPSAWGWSPRSAQSPMSLTKASPAAWFARRSLSRGRPPWHSYCPAATCS
eukprot:324839-Pyramimonas_sp.AAC.1